MHPRDRERVILKDIFLLGREDLEGRSGSFSSFSLCFEVDD